MLHHSGLWYEMWDDAAEHFEELLEGRPRQTCNAVIAHKQREYSTRRHGGEPNGAILDSMGVPRMCCRRMFISHVDLVSHRLPPRRRQQHATRCGAHSQPMRLV